MGGAEGGEERGVISESAGVASACLGAVGSAGGSKDVYMSCCAM